MTVFSLEDFVDAERARCRALVAGDVDALEAMLADGLVYVHSTGAVDDKASYVQKVRSGVFRYLLATPTIERAHLHGTTAVIHGRFDLEAQVGERRIRSNNPFVASWVGSDGGMRLVAWAAAPRP